MSSQSEFHAKVDALTKKLSDAGMIVQAGWVSYRHYVMPANAPDIQIKETQQAFYAGCQHLFGSIMSALDDDKEPTEADMQRMTNIAKELEEFGSKFRDVAMPPKGRA